MVGKVIKMPLVYQSYRWYSPEQKQISVRYHGRIVDALAAGDAEEAELTMHEHVLQARDVLVSRVPAGDDGAGGSG
jgi:DNA-binding GntR family transcriptional regulator